MAGEKILIVDDNATNVRVLLDYLEKSGFEVLVASSGERALRQLTQIRPALILLDVLMPGIDGFETCLRLKQNEQTKDIPVVFMTALTDLCDKVRGFEVGGVDYLTKPLNYQEVLIRVETHIKVRELQRQLEFQNVTLEEKNRALRHEVLERQEAENMLKQTVRHIELAKQEWETTADSLSHLVCLLDHRGAIIRANRTVEHWQLGEVVSVKGKQVHDLLHPVCQTSDCKLFVFLTTALRSVTEQHEAVECEMEDALLQRYISIQVRPISTDTDREWKNSTSFAVCIVHDITKRKQTERALQQRTDELSLLNQLSDQLQACQTEEETYPVLVNMCARLLPLSSGSFSIMSEDQGNLTEVASWGNPPQDIRKFGIDDPWVFDYDQDDIAIHPHTGRLSTHIGYSLDGNYLCVPISVSGKIMAILSIHLETNNPKHSYAAHIDPIRMVLTGVIEHYALSLINLRLQDRLRQEAIIDPLTGLYNRRHMEASLARESRRAQRRNMSLGFIMLDVDHFKGLNDTYSHEAGDVVLRELGLLLHRHIRAEDIACRYGGEEFLLILPDASLNDTKQRAEELRFMVRELSIRYHEHTLKITVSMGVSTLPSHGLRCNDALKSADMALYEAKRQGRDRVVVASSS